MDVPCLAELTSKNRLPTFNLTVGRGRSSDKLHLLDHLKDAEAIYVVTEVGPNWRSI